MRKHKYKYFQFISMLVFPFPLCLPPRRLLPCHCFLLLTSKLPNALDGHTYIYCYFSKFSLQIKCAYCESGDGSRAESDLTAPIMPEGFLPLLLPVSPALSSSQSPLFPTLSLSCPSLFFISLSMDSPPNIYSSSVYLLLLLGFLFSFCLFTHRRLHEIL